VTGTDRGMLQLRARRGRLIVGQFRGSAALDARSRKRVRCLILLDGNSRTGPSLSTQDLDRRTIERRAVEVVICGTLAVNYDLMEANQTPDVAIHFTRAIQSSIRMFIVGIGLPLAAWEIAAAEFDRSNKVKLSMVGFRLE
jgi:hypothetical protein